MSDSDSGPSGSRSNTLSNTRHSQCIDREALPSPPSAFSTQLPSLSKRKSPSRARPIPRPIHTPSSPQNSSSSVPILPTMLPSAPASPPTPAPSPTPSSRRAPDWSSAAEHEDLKARDLRAAFADMHHAERLRLLAELLNMCNSKELSFVQEFVSPRLKKDPFTSLPDELCLRVLTFLDDPRSLSRSAQVSHRWLELVSDDAAWKALCEKHAYRRPSDKDKSELPYNRASYTPISPLMNSQTNLRFLNTPQSMPYASSSAPDLRATATGTAPLTRHWSSSHRTDSMKRRNGTKPLSYRSHFKQRYQVETAWRSGGRVDHRQITPDQGVVTSLHLTDKYIVVALDNAKIHVFDTEGCHQKTLQGHVMGVWAMVPWEDVLVSGGCDRDVRVWNMATGTSIHTLRGHTSTVRCLKMSDSTTAISGSRDTTLRIWDIQKGICKHVLVGHGASVRCMDIHGDLIVSGSYDTTAKIWSISEGRCLRTLSGHFSQIYAVAFDGKKIATGSLDTSVRLWDPKDGRCLGVLQGHTSLVGQLQMRGDVLVTGGSDGSLRVWSLREMAAIHRLAAHDNSVTSLQFDESRIVSGGSDGRVKVWDLKKGTLVRELSQPAEAVWRVVFEEEKAIVMASRNQRTVMEVWNFAPPEEDITDLVRSTSPASLPDTTMTGYQDALERPASEDVTMLDAAVTPVPESPSGASSGGRRRR